MTVTFRELGTAGPLEFANDKNRFLAKYTIYVGLTGGRISYIYFGLWLVARERSCLSRVSSVGLL
jgi:hypothetical protein